MGMTMWVLTSMRMPMPFSRLTLLHLLNFLFHVLQPLPLNLLLVVALDDFVHIKKALVDLVLFKPILFNIKIHLLSHGDSPLHLLFLTDLVLFKLLLLSSRQKVIDWYLLFQECKSLGRHLLGLVYSAKPICYVVFQVLFLNIWRKKLSWCQWILWPLSTHWSFIQI